MRKQVLLFVFAVLLIVCLKPCLVSAAVRTETEFFVELAKNLVLCNEEFVLYSLMKQRIIPTVICQ